MAPLRSSAVLVTILICVMTSNVHCHDDFFLFDTFPEGFKWGVASAAYQVEGGWNADGKGEGIWDRFSHQPGTMLEGATGDISADSYHHYKEDLQLIKNLGVDFYRFSIAWSRVIPLGKLSTGVNEAGVTYYNNVINGLIALGIEPVATIYHWDLPQALHDDDGGWLNEKIIPHYNDFATLCFQRFGDRVKRWITFNEPFVFTWFGYGLGLFAPGLKDPKRAIYQVTHTILKAHATAWHTYDNTFRQWQHGKISLTLFSEWKEPFDENNESDVIAAVRAIEFNMGWFAHPVYVNGDYPEVMKRHMAAKSRAEGLNTSRLPEFTDEEKKFINHTYDFFGLNHYATKMVRNSSQGEFYNMDADVEDISLPSWQPTGTVLNPVVPWGIRRQLNWIRTNYGNPEVHITENGHSDSEEILGTLNDEQRIDFIQAYTNNVLKAIRLDGCNVAAYTYWSLLDSLEWSAGYTLKFGLYNVNFTDPDRERTAKDSATYYAALVKDNGWKCPAGNAYLDRTNRCPLVDRPPSWRKSEETMVDETPPRNVSTNECDRDHHSRIPRRVCEYVGHQLHCFRRHQRRC